MTQANRQLDEQRRVIEMVSRRCFSKGKNHHCLSCEGRKFCGIEKPHEEIRLCISM